MPDLLELSDSDVREIERSAGSFLGSNRGPINDDALEILRRADIHTLLCTGGNGTMAAALELSRAANFELQVIGIPKTIDNDLVITHHTPGYLSTAHFFAQAARDAGIDNRSLPSPICILETLGRNVGWIVAATLFARRDPYDADEAPHLIYYPERRVSLDTMAAEVEAVYRRLGRVAIVVCEGQLDETGQPFGADLDRHLASNLGHTLARRLSEKLGLRARAEKPGLIGRSCSVFAVERDRRESYECGKAAVQAMLDDASGVMVALGEDSTTFLTPLENVAGKERAFPCDWIDGPGFLDYAISAGVPRI